MTFVTAVKDFRTLASLPLFDGLSSLELEQVNAVLRSTKFPAGATVMTADQPGEVAYLVLTGTLRVSNLRADGSEVVLALLGPGEIVGELSLIDRATRSANVTTIEPSTLLWFDRSSYGRFRTSIPRISDNLVVLLARRLRLANTQIQALATLDVQGRVARQLLALADVYGAAATGGGTLIDVRLTQSDLAALCGATRVRVNQALGTFKKLGYLDEASRHRIKLLDVAALFAYCE